jgi:hypothetical protein
MALAALGLTEAPVHEPVHGRRQAISVAVTQRGGLGLPQYSDGLSDDLARGDPGRVHVERPGRLDIGKVRAAIGCPITLSIRLRPRSLAIPAVRVG